jgi:hypothetical protein
MQHWARKSKNGNEADILAILGSEFKASQSPVKWLWWPICTALESNQQPSDLRVSSCNGNYFRSVAPAGWAPGLYQSAQIVLNRFSLVEFRPKLERTRHPGSDSATASMNVVAAIILHSEGLLGLAKCAFLLRREKFRERHSETHGDSDCWPDRVRLELGGIQITFAGQLGPPLLRCSQGLVRAKANTKILLSRATKTHPQTLGNVCKLVESQCCEPAIFFS